MKPKILVWDTETSPSLAWVFRRWKENIQPNRVESESILLTTCWKWLGQKKVSSTAIPDFTLDPQDDEGVVRKTWEVLDECDIAVAHNGDRFDTPVVNSRFAFYGLPPPSGYLKIDTLKIARRVFRFPSNRLGALCDYLRLPHKKQESDFEMWRGCLKGDPGSWRKMVSYCKDDVRSLEGLYLALRAWDDQHPNVSLWDEDVTCPACGGSSLTRRGWAFTKTQKYRRYQCDCGHWCRGRYTHLENKETLVNSK